MVARCLRVLAVVGCLLQLVDIGGRGGPNSVLGGLMFGRRFGSS
jgi:hypothetical protein